MLRLKPLGSNCNSYDCRVMAGSPTSNPPTDTSTIGRSICDARTYTCCQFSQRILGKSYGIVVKLVVVLALCQDNRCGFDQGRKTNAGRAVKDHSDLVCSREQGYYQEVPFGIFTGMGCQSLHPTRLSQSTRTSSDRKTYRRMGGETCCKHPF